MRLREIESPRNPVIKEALRIKEKRSRYRHGAFIVEGPNLLGALVHCAESRAGVGRVFLTGRFREKDPRLVEFLARDGAEMYEVPEHIMRKLSDTETPQGIVAVASYAPYGMDETDFRGVTVVCDGIQDPGNLGTIIRTADAAGAGAVALLPGTCDAFMPKALRASAGSIFNVPVVYAGRRPLIARLKERGVRICVAAPDAETPLFEADLSPDIAIVLGNESRGVSAEFGGSAEVSVRIPIEGRAESLNVTASAAVLLYEALRQRAGGRDG